MSNDIIHSAFDLLTTHVIIDLTPGYNTVLKTDRKIPIHSDRNISMVEKKNFTTFNQVKRWTYCKDPQSQMEIQRVYNESHTTAYI